MNDPDAKLLVLILLAAGLAGALWVFRNDILPRVVEPDVMQPNPSMKMYPPEAIQYIR